MIIHIVMFKFKDRDSDAVQKAKTMLENLVGVVPSLIKMEVGIDFNGSERAYDLSLYSTFETKEGLSEYAIHPEHLKVKDFLMENTTSSVVVDYEL